MSLDLKLQTFHTDSFQILLDQAIDFLYHTPIHPLPPEKFSGTGVYILYYLGEQEYYAPIAKQNRKDCVVPIYVGKAVPRGWRTGRNQDTSTPILYGRLSEHARSITQAKNIGLQDFRCRFVRLIETTADLIVPLEAELIRRHQPLWNTIVDGFGNHDPGKGRYNQAPSEWDVLHPGRYWVKRLNGTPPKCKEIIERINQFHPRKSDLP